jgi:hypothetical protein
MRVSDYFRLGRTQPYLDFVDVRLDTDIKVFVDPAAIRILSSAWGTECVSLLQHFFESVLKRIGKGNDQEAVSLLASLNERNEFHLGYSKGKSRGKALGRISASQVWKALSKSKAAKSTLLQDLEDTCLLIRGIDTDIISDAVCNIIRGPLVKYTQEMCAYHGIPTEPNVDSGPIWNPQAERWEHKLIQLPMTPQGKLVLVPKIIVRHRLWYKAEEYYRHYLLPEMQQEELRAKSGLVQTLKDGRKRVTKKSLMEKYGADKLAIVEQTLKHPQVLKGYRQTKRRNPPKPLTHEDFAEIETTYAPDWNELLSRLRAIPTGNDDANDYENVVESILTALFYPSLCNPVKQHELHEGRKRVDITYVNVARVGFFAWLSQHYTAPHIFIECKNYGNEVGNPELDQLAGRFSPSRGQVGILVCRKIADPKTLMKRCRDTADDHRGFILAVDDELLQQLIQDNLKNSDQQRFTHLRDIFNRLIM